MICPPTSFHPELIPCLLSFGALTGVFILRIASACRCLIIKITLREPDNSAKCSSGANAFRYFLCNLHLKTVVKIVLWLLYGMTFRFPCCIPLSGSLHHTFFLNYKGKDQGTQKQTNSMQPSPFQTVSIKKGILFILFNISLFLCLLLAFF